MTAADIKPGMAIKRQGYENYRMVKSVQDMDGKLASRHFRNKMEIIFQDGHRFHLSKDEIVTVDSGATRDLSDIEVIEPTQI